MYKIDKRLEDIVREDVKDMSYNEIVDKFISLLEDLRTTEIKLDQSFAVNARIEAELDQALTHIRKLESAVRQSA